MLKIKIVLPLKKNFEFNNQKTNFIPWGNHFYIIELTSVHFVESITTSFSQSQEQIVSTSTLQNKVRYLIVVNFC